MNPLSFLSSVQIPDSVERISLYVAIITGLCTLMATIAAFVQGGPDGCKKFFKGVWRMFVWVTSFIHSPWTVATQMRKFQESLDAVKKSQDEARRDLDYIKAEQSANGWTSQKDISLLLLGELKRQKRSKPYPLFLRDSDGKNIVVSRAYCDLVGIHEEEDLHGLNWKRFVYHEDLESYVRTFNDAAESRSVFRAVSRLVDVDAKDLGMWEAVAEVMLKEKKSRLVYEGILRPLDALAKKVAEEKGFEYD